MESVFHFHVELVGKPQNRTVIDACTVAEPAPIHGIRKQVGQSVGAVCVAKLVDVERIDPIVLEPKRRTRALPPSPCLVEVDSSHCAHRDGAQENNPSGKYMRRIILPRYRPGNGKETDEHNNHNSTSNHHKRSLQNRSHRIALFILLRKKRKSLRIPPPHHEIRGGKSVFLQWAAVHIRDHHARRRVQSKDLGCVQTPATFTRPGRGSNQKRTIEEVKWISRTEVRDGDLFIQREE